MYIFLPVGFTVVGKPINETKKDNQDTLVVSISKFMCMMRSAIPNENVTND